jgi:hypothetical protein
MDCDGRSRTILAVKDATAATKIASAGLGRATNIGGADTRNPPDQHGAHFRHPQCHTSDQIHAVTSIGTLRNSPEAPVVSISAMVKTKFTLLATRIVAST